MNINTRFENEDVYHYKKFPIHTDDKIIINDMRLHCSCHSQLNQSNNGGSSKILRGTGSKSEVKLPLENSRFLFMGNFATFPCFSSFSLFFCPSLLELLLLFVCLFVLFCFFCFFWGGMSTTKTFRGNTSPVPPLPPPVPCYEDVEILAA